MTSDTSQAAAISSKVKFWAGIGVAILAVGVAATYFGLCGTCTAKKPNIFVILVDTLRADHLGMYGYSRNTSPALDAFSKEAIIATHAVTAAPWTPSSVASLFSGLYVSSHGWQPPAKRSEFLKTGTVLSSSIDTLAERLKRAGYVTGAISPNPWITPQFGFNQGFDRFWTRNRADAENMTLRAKSAIRMLRSPSAPLFLYIHYLDPHDPYKPPHKYRSMFQGPPPNGDYPEHVHDSMNRYDGEIRFTDDMIGTFFEHLKSEGLYENSIIVFIADHGEQFYERGDLGHGHQLYQPETHIPLVIKLPYSSQIGKIGKAVSTVDVLPTILSIAGIETTGQHAGVSLLDEAALAAREGILSEIKRDYSQKAFVTPDGLKLLFGTSTELVEGQNQEEKVIGQFDIVNDPREAKPIADAAKEESLKEKLGHALSVAAEGSVKQDKASGAVDEETIKQLKSLGYIQ